MIYMQHIPGIMKINIRIYSVLNWTVDVSVCRRFGLLTFWFVDVLVCRRFDVSTFRFVDVSVFRRLGCRCFVLSTFWSVTHKRVDSHTSRPGYKNGHHFADDISKYNLQFTVHRPDIINISHHSNIVTPAFHRWCLAPNIVPVIAVTRWYGLMLKGTCRGFSLGYIVGSIQTLNLYAITT